MSYIKNSDRIEDNDREIEDINDCTSWHYRKFDEMLEDLKDPKDWKQSSSDHQPNIEAWKTCNYIRKQLYHAKDIQKDALGGGRVSIINDPSFFEWKNIKGLKYALRHMINDIISDYENITIKDHEIIFRYGAKFGEKELFVDYYVIINKNPDPDPKDLETIVTWGLF